VGVKIENPASLKSHLGRQKLKGKTFALTGSLKTMTREEAKREIRKLGGSVSGSVSKKTNFLVVGKEPGSKLKKVEELGIKIVKEKEFLKIVS